MTGCDICGAPVVFRAYASYNADQGENAHPLHARYPAPMYRSCAEHIGELLRDEPGSLLPPQRQWLVVQPLNEEQVDEYGRLFARIMNKRDGIGSQEAVDEAVADVMARYPSVTAHDGEP